MTVSPPAPPPAATPLPSTALPPSPQATASRHTRRVATITSGPRSGARSRSLHEARRGEDQMPATEGRRWGTLAFMVVVHALAILALLPRFWSWQSVATLLVLYWVTACLGVTIGYHRLLSHRSFQLPQWLERFFATCGALSCQHGPIDWVGLHRHHHKFSDTDADHHD
ncbi:MAG: acyl-CoA desaturase, partial [Cyanobacteriota bacterium]|nr:acyl-CoA desaturase [Cyanobacteriota bacterium]